MEFPEKQSKFLKKFYLLLFLSAGLFCIFINQKSTGLDVQDGYDYAQIARNIADGNGYTTSLILPLACNHYYESGYFPDLWRPPLFPLILALFFKFFSPDEHIILAVSGIFFILLTPLVYLLGKTLYNSMVGVLASLLTLAIPEIVIYSTNCLTESLFCCLFLLACYCVCQKKSPWVSGVICGLCYLTRYNFIFFIPPFLWYGFNKDKKDSITFSGKLLVAFLITISPWIARNVYAQQKPFFSLQYYEVALFTPEYPH